MKYSRNWLQEHLATPLPPLATLAKEVTLRAFEVEEVEEHGDDALLEIKVLPDRAHDALSHRGMAREIGALLGVARKERVYNSVTRSAPVQEVKVVVEDSALCPRYLATRIDGVTVMDSPGALKSKIEVLGGRSINNLVDITNVILFDIGQPLHVFDADKVVGGITVRLAMAGEEMMTLDNKSVTLSGGELVIADDEGVLALAGVKGGKKAEVSSTTTSIILECANFDPTLTRKTSQRLNIKTDASKRYENGITSAFAGESCVHALALIAMYGGKEVKIGATTDVYPVPETPVTVAITSTAVNRLLGLTLTDEKVAEVLARAQLSFTKNDKGEFLVNIPEERLDLRIKEDMIEEIGRHVGYENIVSVLPKLTKKGVPNKRLYYANKVRQFLAQRGYSEVYTYSFTTPNEFAELEVTNPVGKDRPFMRKTVHIGITRALRLNKYNAPLISIEDVNIFEFGNVFSIKEGKNQEHMSFAVGVAVSGKSKYKIAKEETPKLFNEIKSFLGAKDNVDVLESSGSDGTGKFDSLTYEIDFDSLIENLPEPLAYESLYKEKDNVRYQTLSAYPFIVRDIAIFVPQEVTEEYIEALLKKEGGELVVRLSQFDKFQKPDETRISYGYRLVFQSFTKTLTDDEINGIMEHVTALCNAENNWQVR